MKPVANWRAVLLRACRIRPMIVAAMLLAIEVALPLLDGFLRIPPSLFAAPSSPASSRRRSFPMASKRARNASIGAVSAVAIVFIQPWREPVAYRDIVGAWAICYGETKGVKPGMVTTDAECDALTDRRVVNGYHRPLTSARLHGAVDQRAGFAPIDGLQCRRRRDLPLDGRQAGERARLRRLLPCGHALQPRADRTLSHGISAMRGGRHRTACARVNAIGAPVLRCPG